MQIQTIPVTDSPNNDAFEAIVETYYQSQGYITSAGKWFWVWEEGKKQRGYQDIDLLAINETESVIVSVTSNLDDKINTKGNVVNKEKLNRLIGHFERVKQYLSTVNQYRWIVSKSRLVRCVVAYNHAYKGTLEQISQNLTEHGIGTLSAKVMLDLLLTHANHQNLKIQNQLLRTIQLIGVGTQ